MKITGVYILLRTVPGQRIFIGPLLAAISALTVLNHHPVIAFQRADSLGSIGFTERAADTIIRDIFLRGKHVILPCSDAWAGDGNHSYGRGE